MRRTKEMLKRTTNHFANLDSHLSSRSQLITQPAGLHYYPESIHPDRKTVKRWDETKHQKDSSKSIFKQKAQNFLAAKPYIQVQGLLPSTLTTPLVV